MLKKHTKHVNRTSDVPHMHTSFNKDKNKQQTLEGIKGD